MSKHIYKVSEQSVDTRNFTIETDKPFNDADERDAILDVICMVSISKKGDEVIGRTHDGVNFKVIYVDTDYGDDGQIDWEYEEVSDESR